MSILKGRKGTEYTVTVQPEGIGLKWLTLEDESGERTIRWEEIASVIAYKRDLLTTDLICLVCTLSDGAEFQFHEELPCWQGLVDALPEHLPGCPAFPEWWHPVALPVFARNETVLFQRSS
jgi:hypothetical protein